MNELTNLQKMSGILTESKYGQKFNQYYGPFKHDDKKVRDKNGKELCECNSTELAKELAAVLTDLKQLRDLCDRIITLPNR